ncbi:uncharacterized protein [Fopius arisanus]|uniref:Uncharacterized protein n=1 Tax=Fopius arisanus TaxID=64838 RepID=A0A9R1UAL2_9HYME|nr:PREDICTED: uncharacterized protein LOC105272708 [Fopius arisanus]XP_011313231.1 PREDICTED: uncharacterized protein LOC105272708 [Fopius arisanus]
MSGTINPFATTNHDEFVWPHPLPSKITPKLPPKNSHRRPFMSRMDPDECECPVHNMDTSLSRYKKLAIKEKNLCKNIAQVNQQMTTLLSHMLENADSSEDVMQSVYQSAFDGNQVLSMKYRPLMAAIDAPVNSPIVPVISELKTGYRDPIRFRYSPVEIPVIEPADPVDFCREPEQLSTWFTPFTGRSVYMDTFSKLGLSNMKNQQQYREPLPSSRRRWGDCKL